MRIGAIGAYPDDPYYDPNRPSWLPYWIDDLTESEAKYNATNIVQATVNATGDAVGSVAASAASGVASAATSAIGGVDISTIAIIAGIGFVIYAFKK